MIYVRPVLLTLGKWSNMIWVFAIPRPAPSMLHNEGHDGYTKRLFHKSIWVFCIPYVNIQLSSILSVFRPFISTLIGKQRRKILTKNDSNISVSLYQMVVKHLHASLLIFFAIGLEIK